MQVSDHPDYRRTVETSSTTPDRAADLSPEQKRAAHAAAAAAVRHHGGGTPLP